MSASGYEAAILGVAERLGLSPVVVYDAEHCLDILMQRDGMTYAEALEFFEFNTIGCWAGEGTPLFLWRVPAFMRSGGE